MRSAWSFAAVVLLSTIGCAPQVGGVGPTSSNRWLIPAGQHESTASTVTLTTADLLSFAVTFDQSAVYISAAPENQLDVNKLRGLSDCGNPHQTDSARFGWRWTGSAIELSAYTYTAGVRRSQPLALIQPGTTHELSLELDGQTYRFTVDGTPTTVLRGCTASGQLKYQLWPYFGGTEVAPHDVTIDILEH